MKSLFCNTVLDCNWLRETHLRGHFAPAFRSFVLKGNEDCPMVLELYGRKNATIHDNPVAVYRREMGELRKTTY